MADPATVWRDLIRAQLLIARKQRDSVRTSSLRSALSAIDNAETPDIAPPAAGAIADSAVGLGAAEVARRPLTHDDIRTVLTAEVTERLAAADLVTAERAATLRAEAAVVAGLLEG